MTEEEPDWVEVEPRDHKWIRDNWDEITDGDEDHYQDVVLFVPRGKGGRRRQWPLLEVGLRAWSIQSWDKGRQRFSFVSSIKRGANSWWEERYGVPRSCIQLLSERITKTLARLTVPQVGNSC